MSVFTQFSSVPQSHLTLCDPMDSSTPGFPVHHQLQSLLMELLMELLMSIKSMMLSNHLILYRPFLLRLQSFPASGSFPMSQCFASGGQSIGVSASTSILPMNTQDWSLYDGLVGASCSPRDSQESSQTPQFKGINSSVLSCVYSPTLTSIHDYWKNHSLD